VTSAKLQDLGVATADIADLNVTTGKLADLAVSTAKLADTAVTNAKLGGNAVDSSKISDGTVAAGDLGTDAVAADGLTTDGSTKVANSAINSDEIAADAVKASEIATDAVASPEIAADAVGTSEIADLAVATVDIANQAITNGKLAPDSVDTTKIAAGAVGTSDIANGASTEGTYRLIASRAGAALGSSGAGNYWMGMGGPALLSGAASATATTTYAPTPAAFQFTAADYTITGRTTKLRLRATVLNNPTAPGANLTVGLYPVSSTGGGVDTASVTLGTVVTGSTVAFSSATLTASSKVQGVTADFDVPSDGIYVLGFNLSGTIGGNSLPNVLADLQVRNQ
jgi:hypothetical protein